MNNSIESGLGGGRCGMPGIELHEWFGMSVGYTTRIGSYRDGMASLNTYGEGDGQGTGIGLGQPTPDCSSKLKIRVGDSPFTPYEILMPKVHE